MGMGTARNMDMDMDTVMDMKIKKNKEMNITFIIQARLGSTRLPGKILLPFYQNQSIIDLLIDKLQKIENTQIILATSDSEKNDPLEEIANERGIKCFRGSENDVLQRFIDAAEESKTEHIIRVCSDNPFLELDSIKNLISFVQNNPTYDYVSYNVNGIPTIKTHYGFWTEYVTLSALKKVASLTSETLYHEHVTNYIYTHLDTFKIKLLSTPEIIATNNKIRLTIDTETDFKNAQKIYEELIKQNQYPTIEEVIYYLDNHPSYYQTMEQEISKNSK